MVRSLVLLFIWLCTTCTHADAAFSFKGKVFGERLVVNDNSTFLMSRFGGRAIKIPAKDSGSTSFGGYELDRLYYLYFDQVLYSVEFDFNPVRGCGIVQDVADLLGERYSPGSALPWVVHEDGIGRYAELRGVKLVLQCEKMLLEDKSYLSVSLFDTKIVKRLEAYKLAVEKRRKNDADLKAKEALRNRIDF